jgi:hypothetical protein
MQSTRIGATVLVITCAAAALSGCGGAGGEGDAPPPADTGLFQQMASYCQAQPPRSGEPMQDGWAMSSVYTGDGTYYYEGNAVISANGSSAEGIGPITLKVSDQDYRGVANNTPIVPVGYSNPDWTMGAVLPAVMSPESVACVVHLAKTRSFWIPAAPVAHGPSVSTILYWRSFWDEAVPMAQLPGYQIDGFEFVGNFTPADGQAYFILDKQGHPAPGDYSICHLAASASQWQCSQPQLTDQGATWHLRVRGLRAGVYVLNAPTPRG